MAGYALSCDGTILALGDKKYHVTHVLYDYVSGKNLVKDKINPDFVFKNEYKIHSGSWGWRPITETYNRQKILDCYFDGMKDSRTGRPKKSSKDFEYGSKGFYYTVYIDGYDTVTGGREARF